MESSIPCRMHTIDGAAVNLEIGRADGSHERLVLLRKGCWVMEPTWKGGYRVQN
jgi:hypothetical protein